MLSTKEAWLKAIRLGNYTKWIGLTIKATNKYFTESAETQKGHMRQTRQRIRPTRKKTQVLQLESDGTIINIPPKNHHNIYVKVTDTKHTKSKPTRQVSSQSPQ